jgi:hypothetical protein
MSIPEMTGLSRDVVQGILSTIQKASSAARQELQECTVHDLIHSSVQESSNCRP